MCIVLCPNIVQIAISCMTHRWRDVTRGLGKKVHLDLNYVWTRAAALLSFRYPSSMEARAVKDLQFWRYWKVSSVSRG